MKWINLLPIFMLVITVACKDSKTDNVKPRKVKCELVTSSCSANIIEEFPGRITPASDVNLSFRVPGVIERIVAKEGKYVAEGDVIAIMDKRDYDLQLAATQAEYDAVKGEVDRVVALYRDSSISENDYQKAVNGEKRLKAKLQSHKNALADTELRAPFNGKVQSVKFDKGEAVSAGMPVVSFVSTSSPEVIINIPTDNYVKRKTLLSATAIVNTTPQVELPLTLSGISAKANANQLHETHFIVNAPKGYDPITGVSVMVKLEYINGNPQLLNVPFTSIVEQKEKRYIWLLKGGETQQVEVEVVSVNRAGVASIKGSVAIGDTVITAGTNSITIGEKLQPLPASSPTNIGGVL